jgi:hypothetical protein
MMTFERMVKLTARLDGLIDCKYRDTATTYTKKLEISRATFFRFLKFIKTDFDAPIGYKKTAAGMNTRKAESYFHGFLPQDVLTQEVFKKIQNGTFSYMDIPSLFARSLFF